MTAKLAEASTWTRGPQFQRSVRWLVANGGASARYKALLELQGKGRNSAAAREAKRALPREGIPKVLLDALSAEGHWKTPPSCTRPFSRPVNDRVITVYLSAILAECGVEKRDDQRIETLADFVLSTQHPSGAFVNLAKTKDNLPVAVTALAVYSLLRFGVPLEDARMQRAFAWLMAQQQRDGGFLGVRKKRCFLATNCVLMAVAENPKLRGSAAVQRAVVFQADHLFDKNIEIPISWTAYRYPQLHYDWLRCLPVLASLGVTIEHAKMAEAVAALFEGRTTEKGLWLQQSPSLGLMASFLDKKTKSALLPKKGEISDMLTFKALKTLQLLFA